MLVWAFFRQQKDSKYEIGYLLWIYRSRCKDDPTCRKAAVRTNGVGLHELLMGIVVENLDGRLFVKIAPCSMLGFSEEELRGTRSVDFPEDVSKD